MHLLFKSDAVLLRNGDKSNSSEDTSSVNRQCFCPPNLCYVSDQRKGIGRFNYTVASSSASALEQSVTKRVAKTELTSCDDTKSYYNSPKIWYIESVSDASHGHKSRPLVSSARSTKILSIKDMSKLHLQMRHGTKKAHINYIRVAGNWDGNIEKNNNNLNQNFECRSAVKSSPHLKVKIIYPSLDPQANISININHLDRKIICIQLTNTKVGPRRATFTEN